MYNGQGMATFFSGPKSSATKTTVESHVDIQLLMLNSSRGHWRTLLVRGTDRPKRGKLLTEWGPHRISTPPDLSG